MTRGQLGEPTTHLDIYNTTSIDKLHRGIAISNDTMGGPRAPAQNGALARFFFTSAGVGAGGAALISFFAGGVAAAAS
jgi:hypothetical protein